MDIELLKSDLDRILGQLEMAGGETMVDVLGRLDAIGESVDTHERLKHYLCKRSYVKARAWLEDPTTPHHL